MSGVLGLGTTWTERLFPGESRREAEALIPEGFQINVVPVNGKPGPWRVVALQVRDERPVEIMEAETYSPAAMVASMTQALREDAA